MLKKYPLIGLFALSMNAHAEQNYSIEITPDNEFITSKNVKVNEFQVLEGLEAAEHIKEHLLTSIETLSKSETMRNIYESEVLIEDLVLIDSFIEKYNDNMNKTQVTGTGSHCGVGTFLDYSFNNGIFNYALDTRATAGTNGPFPPNTPTQFVQATSTIDNISLRTDTDFSSNQSFSVTALASVQSGGHSSASQLPFVSQGFYLISTNGCFATKVITVQGTKSFSTLPTITSIVN